MKKQKRTILLLTILILVLTVLIVVLLLLKGKDKEGYEYQMSLGKQLMEQEKYDEALYCFEQAMEIEPKKEEPYMCMADIYEIQGRFDKMAEILQLGCDRAKEAGLAEQYERLAECLSEAREMAAEAGQLPESVTDDGVSDEAPAALTGEKLFEASQVINVLLDWKMCIRDRSCPRRAAGPFPLPGRRPSSFPHNFPRWLSRKEHAFHAPGRP